MSGTKMPCKIPKKKKEKSLVDLLHTKAIPVPPGKPPGAPPPGKPPAPGKPPGLKKNISNKLRS